MATTSTPYGQFLLAVGQGQHNVLANPISVVLLTSGYTPNYTNDYLFAPVAQYEVPNDTAIGGYNTGGRPLANRTFTYDGQGGVAMLAADAITWDNLTATFLYAALLDAVDSANVKMLGLLNFGVERQYNGEQFTLSFNGGVMTLSGAGS